MYYKKTEVNILQIWYRQRLSISMTQNGLFVIRGKGN